MSLAKKADQFRNQSVLNASPERLRLMLLERGVEIAQRLAALTPAQVGDTEFVERLLLLREILGELLSGITDGNSEVARQVSDLYVFLLKFLTETEANPTRKAWQRIAEILEIERETWQQVCHQRQQVRSSNPSAPASPTPSAGSLNLQI